MGEHDHGTDPGSAADRPAFDEVAHGYDPRQVDDYLASLWRYASQVTSRAAAAESALKHERERNEARAGDAQSAAHAGARIGQMLAIAEQQAEEIVEGARRIAESALEEVIEDAGANHPIVREARGQAEKLLLDAVEESQRLALRRHQELAEDLARSSASLDTLRHQQGEIIGAVLRLRGILGSDELDRAVTELARAGAAPRPDGPADETGSGAGRGARRPTSAAQDPADGVRNGSGPSARDGAYPGGPGSGAGVGTAATGAGGGVDPGGSGLGGRPFGRPGSAGSGSAGSGSVSGGPGPGGPGPGGTATGGLGDTARAGDGTAPWPGGGSAEPYPGDGAAHQSFWAGAGESGGGSGWTAGAAASGVGAGGAWTGGGLWADGATATMGGAPGRGPGAGFGRRAPGRHRQADTSGADEAAAAGTTGVPFRRGADEEIVDAEIVEE